MGKYVGHGNHFVNLPVSTNFFTFSTAEVCCLVFMESHNLCTNYEFLNIQSMKSHVFGPHVLYENTALKVP